jgi:hypothetical protein
MNWAQLTNGIKAIWENKPGVVVLVLLGFVVFIVVVWDTRRHRQRQKNRGPKKY